jgi:HK97 family phage prohead protease
MTRATRFSAPVRKLLADPTLGARQIKVCASDGTPDRDNDVLDPAGCDFGAYRSNPIVLMNHDPAMPIATADVARKPLSIEATITFAPPGVSAKADEYCGLAKAGILSAVSVGFTAIEAQPRGNGRGVHFSKWELLELSLVSVPSNPRAVVPERALPLAKDGRVLAARTPTRLRAPTSGSPPRVATFMTC